MTTAQRAIILNNLAKVNPESIVGISIRTFIQSAHTKTDLEIIDCIKAIQSQINDNPSSMKTILGKQFHYFKHLKFEHANINHQATSR